MTPTEIETAARRAYNSVGDTFWSSEEIMNLIYFAQMELVREGLIIERRYTTNTVADQREYDYPSQLLSIKRITYDGEKLTPIDFRDDDEITLYDEDTTDSGEPKYYSIWNETILLRPIPSSVAELKIYGYSEPQEVSITSTLEAPTLFHPRIVDFVVKEMVIKDSNFKAYDIYNNRWEKALIQARQWKVTKKRQDANAIVKNVDAVGTYYTGKL